VAGIGLFAKVMSEERPEDGLEASHVYFRMMISGRRKRQCKNQDVANMPDILRKTQRFSGIG
jgi:hypothetical protein